ncbi:hypothetical protein [Owenweeksia hongkongensis]|uniref:hypothetical protein n=1 Tax=Owenweeksia hongkongensis TaxID=253245 RepID=UPI0002E49402|nr:hypothetical protein [Owenweeksia hongkongensis]
MLKKYRTILKEEGWKGLIKREGWKVGALLFTFFLAKGLVWLAIFYGLFEVIAD